RTSPGVAGSAGRGRRSSRCSAMSASGVCGCTSVNRSRCVKARGCRARYCVIASSVSPAGPAHSPPMVLLIDDPTAILTAFLDLLVDPATARASRHCKEYILDIPPPSNRTWGTMPAEEGASNRGGNGGGMEGDGDVRGDRGELTPAAWGRL